jgi:hypothetical protein
MLGFDVTTMAAKKDARSVASRIAGIHRFPAVERRRAASRRVLVDPDVFRATLPVSRTVRGSAADVVARLGSAVTEPSGTSA